MKKVHSKNLRINRSGEVEKVDSSKPAYVSVPINTKPKQVSIQFGKKARIA